MAGQRRSQRFAPEPVRERGFEITVVSKVNFRSQHIMSQGVFSPSPGDPKSNCFKLRGVRTYDAAHQLQEAR
jgi:hypothetical protein